MSAEKRRYAANAASLGLVLSVLCLFLACAKSPPSAERGPVVEAIPAKITAIAPRVVPRYDEYLASLTSRRSIALYSHVSGYVQAIFAKPGERVAEGAELIGINPGRELQTLASLKAGLRTRRAQYEFAKKNDEKSQALAAGGLISSLEYDRRYSQRVAAESEVQQAEAQVNAHADQLRFYKIAAPSDGVVGDVPVRVGDYVTPQTRLTSVEQDKLIEAYIYVPIGKANRIQESTDIQIVDDQRHVLCEAKASFVSATVSVDTQTVLVKAACLNGGALRAAQVITARIVWGRDERLTLPIASALRQVGHYFAFVAERTPTGIVARQRPIEVDGIFENDFVIQSGLRAGDEVIMSNVQRMIDGISVAEKLPEAPAR